MIFSRFRKVQNLMLFHMNFEKSTTKFQKLIRFEKIRKVANSEPFSEYFVTFFFPKCKKLEFFEFIWVYSKCFIKQVQSATTIHFADDGWNLVTHFKKYSAWFCHFILLLFILHSQFFSIIFERKYYSIIIIDSISGHPVATRHTVIFLLNVWILRFVWIKQNYFNQIANWAFRFQKMIRTSHIVSF